MSNVYLFFWLMLLGARQPITAIAPHSKRCAPQKLPSPAARPGQWVPFTAAREAANKIEEDRIAEMELSGDFSGAYHGSPNLHIKDRWLIHLFVDALRNAQRWSGNPELAGNIRSELIFRYRDRKAHEENPWFPFNVWDFNQHYGRSFERALLKLAEVRAGELRAFVKRHAGEVTALTFTDGKTLESSEELERVLKELKAVKTSNGFNYLNNTGERELTFTLKNGKKQSFYLCFRQQSKPAMSPAAVKSRPKPDPFFSSRLFALTQPDIAKTN